MAKSKSRSKPNSNTEVPQQSVERCSAGTEVNATDTSAAKDNSDELALTVNRILNSSCFLDSLVEKLVDKVVERLKESIDFNTQIIADLNEQLSKRDEKIKDMEKQIESIKADSEEEIEQLNQYLRRNNVEIHGVPELPSEDVYCLLNNIGKSINCEVDKSDIDIAHRIPSSNKSLPRPIVVKFANRWKKQEFLAARKNTRQLSSCDIGINAANCTIYVNDHLTPRSKGLLKRAKDLRMKGFKYIWSREGKIFVRKDDSSRVMLIKSIADIAELEAV